jgi:hypothetical protein
MRKLYLVLVFTIATSVAMAQKGKIAKPAASNNATALTQADANNFIVYANSIGHFFSYYFESDFIPKAYRVHQQNARLKANESADACRRDMEPDMFTKSMALYKSEIGSSTSGEYVLFTKAPAKMDKTTATEVLNLFGKYETKYTALATHFNTVLRPLYNECRLAKNTQTSDVDNALATYLSKSEELWQIQMALYKIGNDLGEQAEDVTLAKHPMKAEIKDMRSLVNQARRATQEADVETREEFVSKEDIIGALLGTMKDLQSKYVNYNQNGKTPKESGLKSSIFKFFEDANRYHQAMEAYSKCIKDPTCKPYYVNDSKKTLESSFEAISDSYSRFVQGNNRD